ncbi:CinA family protein [Micromonospora sp. WMMD714]|uniref:CinA family protein n=1 Tax=Micromonospora sp. WMMD714 TaxID=3016097 RepID=UPI00249B7939|nr:CinA family protein [Micromonospora sp. WMMD714]WFE64563.1 CinA family protein [Micromonospora sp. WMMD714]
MGTGTEHGPTVGSPTVGSPAAGVVHSLHERRQTLATVESLTGGLLAAAIVEIAGVSAVYRGGLVTYATELKARLADVPEDLLAERGPVDPDVAVALAEGGRRRCAADWGLATTGVAGPEPQDGRPVGLVYVAVAGPGGPVVRRLDLDGGRDRIRATAVTEALRLLAERIHGSFPAVGPAPRPGPPSDAPPTGTRRR